MSDVHYRTARAEDTPAVAAIFSKAFEQSIRHYTSVMPTQRLFADIFGACLKKEPDSLTVAEAKNTVVGYVLALRDFPALIRYFVWRGPLLKLAWHWLTGDYKLPLRSALLAAQNWLSLWWNSRRSDSNSGTPARILSIAVTPCFQGKGIGSQLVEIALQRLKEAGRRKVRLEVRPDNKTAICVYEKYGFKVKGKIWDTQGEWLVMVVDLA